MRIFYAFLIVFTMAILLMLPFTLAIYDFRTDLREDAFSVTTAPGGYTAGVVLVKPLYDDDTSTVTILSGYSLDSPAVDSYTSGTRVLDMSGLTEDTTRTLTVSYDVYALSGFSAIDTLVARFDLIWIIVLVAFAPAALAAIFIGRAG